MSAIKRLKLRNPEFSVMPSVADLLNGDLLLDYTGPFPSLFANIGGTLVNLRNIPEGTPVNAVASTLATELDGDNNDLVYTAKTKGVVGDGISIAYVAPDAANAALSVAVVGKAITVNLATGADKAVTSTAAQVKTAIDAAAAAAALVAVANATGNDGSGVVTAMAEASLDNGVDGTVGAHGTVLHDDNYLYLAKAANTIADANWVSIDLAALGTDVSALIGVLTALTTTEKSNLVGAINEVDADVNALETAQPNYLLAVTAGQKMFRNTVDVTGSLVVDLSASFDSIDEVVVVLGAAPSADAVSVAAVIPAQAGADAGKFTINVAKFDAGTFPASEVPTTVHYIGIGTPKAA